MKKRRGIIRALFITIILISILSFIKLPYYITQPGAAFPLDKFVEVGHQYEADGSFSLMTVSFGRANIISYIIAKFNEFHIIEPAENVVIEGETDEDYLQRQLQMMESSQESAVSLAYKEANKSITETFNGVYIVYVDQKMPAYGKLDVGDRIYQVDDLTFQTSEQFVQYVGTKMAGDEVTIHFQRDDEEMVTTVKVAPFPEIEGKTGIGISLMTDLEIETDPNLSLDTENIGGPSAGLMMALEIFNQLTDEDYTRGYKIAGTGTIDQTGLVGPIGGISQKVVAADKANIDIFFAPNEKGIETSNCREAVEAAEKINTDMKIIPIDTFYDAVDFLKDLEPKENK